MLEVVGPEDWRLDGRPILPEALPGALAASSGPLHLLLDRSAPAGLLVGLAFRVSLLRRAGVVSLGDGGNPRLLAAVRAHANCTEWAPIGLILLALAERSAGPVWYVTALALLFVGARLLHPLGMASPAPHPARAAPAGGD